MEAKQQWQVYIYIERSSGWAEKGTDYAVEGPRLEAEQVAISLCETVGMRFACIKEINKPIERVVKDRSVDQWFDRMGVNEDLRDKVFCDRAPRRRLRLRDDGDKS